MPAGLQAVVPEMASLSAAVSQDEIDIVLPLLERVRRILDERRNPA